MGEVENVKKVKLDKLMDENTTTPDLKKLVQDVLSQLAAHDERKKFLDGFSKLTEADQKTCIYDLESTTIQQEGNKLYYLISCCYGLMANWEEQLAAYLKVDLRDFTAAEKYKVYYNLGTCYGMLNRHQEAIQYFEESLKLNKDFIQSAWNLGFALYAVGKYKRARNTWLSMRILFETSSTQDFNNSDLIDFAENELYNLRNPEKAIPILKKYKGTDFKFHYTMAISYFTAASTHFESSIAYMEALNKARSYKEKAFDLLKGNPAIDKELEIEKADLRSWDKEFDAAVELIKSSANGLKDPDALHALGQCLVNLGKLDEAILVLEKSKNESSGKSEIRLTLAEAFRRSKKFDESRYEINHVQANHPFNIDAIKSLINLNIDQGDSYPQDDENNYDILYCFDAATKAIKLLLEKHNDPEFSRGLTDPELSQLHFFQAYSLIKSYQHRKNASARLLKEALSACRNVSSQSKYHIQADSLAAKIRHYLNLKIKSEENTGRPLLRLGVMVMIFGLILFAFGRPSFTGFVKIDLPDSVALNIDSAKLSKIKSVRFVNEEVARLKLEDVIRNHDVNEAWLKRSPKLTHFDPVPEAFIYWTFFAGLALITLGIVFNEIKSVQLPGGIQIERNSLNNDLSPTFFKLIR